MVSRGNDVYDGEGGGTNGSAAERTGQGRRMEVHGTRFGV